MRRMKKALCLLFAAVLAFVCIPAAPAKAAEDGYTYTVRFYSGQQGLINGGEVLELTGLEYGQRVNFNQNIVTLTDGSKYYIRGIRESGKDNNTSGAVSFLVTGDQDYVVAYGLLGSAVAYTVNYVDENGEALAPGEVYYGNVGDKPVIAFLYIDGYLPQAYNLTRTLSENAAENDFTFVYSPIEEPEAETPGGGAATETVTEEVIVVPGTEETGTPTPPVPPAAGAADGAAAGGAGAAGGGAAGAGGGAAGADGGNVAAPDGEVPQAGPQETLDLDDEEVPLSNMPGGGLSSILDMSPDAVAFRIVSIGAGVTAAGVAALASLWYFKKRRKKEGNEE